MMRFGLFQRFTLLSWLLACSPIVLGQQVIPACPSNSSVTAAAPVIAASNLPQGLISLNVVGQIGGPTRAVAVRGAYAYVGVGTQLVVLDVSNPSAPNQVGASDPLKGAVQDIALAGSYAYVAVGSAGLYVLDISNSAQPRVAGSYDTPGFAESVTVAGSYAYVADGPGGLRVVDITNPAKLTEVAAAFRLNYIFGVTLVGSRAYMAAAGAGLLVADVSVPTSPVEITHLDTPGFAYGIAATGQTVYIADGWGGLRVVDVTNPVAPTNVGSYQTSGWAMNVAVSGNMLYIADANAGIRAMDVSDRARPVELGGLQFRNGHAQRLAVSGNIAFVADQRLGLHVVDVTAPAQPVRLAFYNPVGFADGVAVAGNYAYLAADSYGLRVIDLSIPSHLRELAAIDMPELAKVVTVAGSSAYVTMQKQQRLYIVDVSDPTHLKSSWYTWDPTLWGVATARNHAVYGGVLIIANEWGLRLINISNPGSPCELGFLKAASGVDNLRNLTATGVVVSGKFAYVTGGALWVVDISDPRNPTKVTEFQDRTEGQSPVPVGAEDVAVSGSLAFVVGSYPGGSRLRVIDISDPKNPKGRGSYAMPPGAHGWGPFLAVAGSTVFVAAGGAGLYAVDVSNPDQPQLAGHVSVGGAASAVVIQNNYVYVAAEEGGLLVLQPTPGSTASQSSGRDRNPLVPTYKNVSKYPRSIAESQFAPSRVQANVTPAAKLSEFPQHKLDRPMSQRSQTDPAIRLHALGGNTCIVNSSVDSGPGTLRQCLQQAGGGDNITFDPATFPPKSPATIKVLTALPALKTGGLTIDASNAGVILDGGGVPLGTDGILINSDRNTVMGLQILRFAGNGVTFAGASDNTIGGDRSRGIGPAGEGNVIAGNKGSGIQISIGPPYDAVCECWVNSSRNKIIGNLVGLDATGAQALGNGIKGVSVQSDDNMVGGPAPSDRNIISGNSFADVYVNGARNKVMGNYIGTDSGGKINLSDTGYWGVTFEAGSSNNTIQRNLITGGMFAGIVLYDTGTSYNEVIGNYLGLDANGGAVLSSGSILNDQPFNKIGGKTPAERNVILGNITLQTRATDNVILGNYVGTDAAATRTLGSGAIGIDIQSNHNFVGGSTEAERNIVAGQVSLSAGAAYNIVAGNSIGTDASGTISLVGTYFNGIALDAVEHNTIQGNKTFGSGNGIRLGSGANFNWLRANRITQSKVSGVEIAQSDENRIEGNAFFNNKVNANDGGKNNRWDDGKKGNYWSDYAGNDANGDKIGDTPYAVPVNGVDRYPLLVDPFSQALLTLYANGAGFVNGTVTSAPAGINCGTTCSASFTLGTRVILTATPATGSTFSGWSVDCTGAGTCTVTMSAARNVTANFIPSGADCLFNWAERTLPQYFAPTGAASVTLTPYYYRYYNATHNYLATSSTDSHIWLLGPVSGNSLLDVGPVTAFMTMAGCSP